MAAVVSYLLWEFLHVSCPPVYFALDLIELLRGRRVFAIHVDAFAIVI